VFCLHGLAVLAKPMMVTLPLLLLLLDIWPLGRSKLWRPPNRAACEDTSTIGELLIEKTPLLLISGIESVLTLLAQHGSAVRTFGEISLGTRLLNAMSACGRYLLKTIWPARLAVYYPYPSRVQWAAVAWASVVLVALTIIALRLLRTRPYIAVGWFWFLGTLVPVIGFIQVGGQHIADRYMYLPMIGLAVMAAWAARDLVASAPFARFALAPLALIVLALCAYLTQRQMRHWKNNFTIGTQALAATSDDNAFAHSLLGVWYFDQGDLDTALAQQEIAERLWPGTFTAQVADLRRRIAERNRQHNP
jgi:hypothetical protein